MSDDVQSFSFTNATPDFRIIPNLAAIEVPTKMAVGLASDTAQGHEIIKTVNSSMNFKMNSSVTSNSKK